MSLTQVQYFSDLIVKVAEDRDKAAFIELFDHFAPRLKGYLMKQGADEALAEEVAQDVMMTLWRKADLFDPKNPMPAPGFSGLPGTGVSTGSAARSLPRSIPKIRPCTRRRCRTLPKRWMRSCGKNACVLLCRSCLKSSGTWFGWLFRRTVAQRDRRTHGLAAWHGQIPYPACLRTVAPASGNRHVRGCGLIGTPCKRHPKFWWPEVQAQLIQVPGTFRPVRITGPPLTCFGRSILGAPAVVERSA